MRYFKNHIGHLFTFIIALQILNMSIDAPIAGMSDNSKTEDDFNYIDTYVEYIAEVILKYDNAIPESKNREQKELQTQKQFEIVFQKIEPLSISFFYEIIEKQFLNFS